MGSSAPKVTQAESKPIFTPGGIRINERLEQVALGLLNPSAASFSPGFRPNFTTEQANAATAARSESGRGFIAPTPITPPIASSATTIAQQRAEINAQIAAIEADEEGFPTGQNAEKIDGLLRQLLNLGQTTPGGGGVGGVGTTLARGGDGATADSLLESFRFKNLVDEFGNPVAQLRPEEEQLRTDQIGSLLASQQRTDIGRGALQRQLLAPNTGQEQSIIDASVNIGSGGFINPFTESLIDRTQFELLKSTNAIRSQAGVVGAGGGSRESVLKGTAAGEATGRIGTILADAARFSETQRAGEADRAFRFARQDIGDIGSALAAEQEFGGGERRGEALGLEAIPRQIEQANREAFFGEEAARRGARFDPAILAQSISALPAGQTIPISQPGQQGIGGDIIGSIGKIASAFLGKG